MRENITQLTYLAAAILFILGLRSLTRPDRARRGMQQAAVGMLFAICGTLINHEIVDYRWIAAGSDHRLAQILGFVAVTCATINVVGGFLITDRMLRMFQRGKKPAAAAAGTPAESGAERRDQA